MQERRKTRRMRTYLGAKIGLNQQNSVMDCLIRNLTSDGAKLVFANTATVPYEFDLAVAKFERRFHARIVWRDVNEAGVVFLPS
jgi:hypothetical protein